MARIITFGELMLRLQPFNYERFVQATSFEASFGGNFIRFSAEPFSAEDK